MTTSEQSDRATAPLDFLEGFAEQPLQRITVLAPEVPPWPSQTCVTADSVKNYATLGNGQNAANRYGATGLMAVVPWHDDCYGDVAAGTIFLFPGIYSDHPPAYDGEVNLNCAQLPPLIGDAKSPALHAQMCALLGQATESFIGFAAKYPFSEQNVSYNSWTCNEYWFGSNALPNDWQLLVFYALKNALAPDPARLRTSDTHSTQTARPLVGSGHAITPERKNTMSKVHIRKLHKSLPAEGDVKLAMSASDATVTNLRRTDDALAVDYVGDLDRDLFERTLTRIAQGDESSWRLSWEPGSAETGGPVGGAAATPYEIDILMSADTVVQLVDNGYQLYGFKAVQSSQSKGKPVVWFQTTSFQRSTKVKWTEQYQAYTSSSAIIPGGEIDASDAYDITLGQTLDVMAGGTGTVVGQPDQSQPIYIHNTTTTQFTCGISQMEGTNARPLSAFPLFGRNSDDFMPIEQVLLMFATTAINTGTVIEQAFSDGLLINLTDDPLRQVTFDINQGWGPTGQPWATPIDSRENIVNLLVQRPSSALSVKRLLARAGRGEQRGGAERGLSNGADGHHAVPSGAAPTTAEY